MNPNAILPATVSHLQALLTRVPTWEWYSPGMFLHVTLFGLVAYHCLNTRREPTSAVLWIFVAWSFPLLGPLLFLVIGINRVPRKAWRRQESNRQFLAARDEARLPMPYMRAMRNSLASEPKSPFVREFNRVMNAIQPDYPLLDGNRVEPLVTGDQAFPRMLESINRARHHVHLQTFIIRDDPVGREFLDLLHQKAREGVIVRFMFDRFGSTGAILRRMFSRYRKEPNMRLAGWTQVNAIKRRFQINLRNHSKVLVVDGREAFTGGINLHVENTTRPGVPPIRDYHFSVLGPVVQELQYSFLRDWYFMTDENPEDLLQHAHFPGTPRAGTALARLANSGPTMEEVDVTSDVFFQCLTSAQRHVLAVTPYFAPTQDILHAFRLCALRGADVQLVVPKHNNYRSIAFAGRALYEELLEAGVRIFERRETLIHAKALIVDDTLALVGSSNMDVRSLRLNYETNMVVFDQSFLNALKNIIKEDIGMSDEIELASWRRRARSRRLAENFCNLFTPML